MTSKNELSYHRFYRRERAMWHLFDVMEKLGVLQMKTNKFGPVRYFKDGEISSYIYRIDTLTSK